MDIDLTRSALVVVDMQNGFLNEQSRHVIPNVVELVHDWRAAGGQVVFTRYINKPGSQFERLIKWSDLQESPEIDLATELREYAEVVIDKEYYTSFVPEVQELASRHGWDTFVFCGVATESCVLKSATDAFEMEYTPFVIEDASASHAGKTAHDAGILVLQRFIGADQIVALKDVLKALRTTEQSTSLVQSSD